MPFLGYLLRRLGSGLISVIGVSVLVFFLLHLVPGDPIDQLAGGDASAEQRKVVEQCLGLDQPKHIQLVRFFGNVLDGTLGHQCPHREKSVTVAARLAEVFPSTLRLALAAMTIALVVALPLGLLAGVRRGSWFDTSATVVSLLGITIPLMLMAPLLLLVFFVILGWFPGPNQTGAMGIVLPAFAVAVHLLAMLARMTRTSVVDVLDEDYIRTAHAKGLPRRIVWFKHALRNALLPVITVAGLQFGSLLSGAIIVEKIFNRPGLGLVLLNAISERNYPVVQGCVFAIAVIYIVVNILVDIAYGLADPRVRLQ